MPADHTPTDETILPGRNPVDVVAAVFDLEPAPAAPISPQEIAEMRATFRFVVEMRGVAERLREVVLPRHIAERVPRLLDAIEALTAFRTDALDTFRAIGLALGLPDPLAADAPADCPAEWNGKLSEKVAAVVAEREALTAKNQRLTDALNTTALEACEAIDDRLKPEIERLTAENARLSRELGSVRRTLEHVVEKRMEEAAEREALKAEVERLTDKVALAKTLLAMQAAPDREADMQELADFGQRYQPETYAADHDWYARHRSQVEAAHAAAKEGAR